MRRAERGYSPGASVGARNTHLVMDLARGTAHGDGGGTAELNHDLHGNPFGTQIPPYGSGISYTFKVHQVNRFTRLPFRPTRRTSPTLPKVAMSGAAMGG
jgi:hypothetical protein